MTWEDTYEEGAALVRAQLPPVEENEGEPMPDTTDLNLHQRLAAVRVALGGQLAKGGTAPQVMGGFKFIEWDDAAEKIGGFMADAGVMMIPSERRTRLEEAGTTASGKPIYRATVWMEIDFVNVDDPHDALNIHWVGIGDDTSDKAVQKAITSAVKYALLKLFLLSGADDSDATAVEHAQTAPVTRNGHTAPTTATPPAPRQTGPVQCPFCKERGWADAKGRVPTFWLKDRGPNTGKYECNGRQPDGGYANHLMPVTAAEEINDPVEIPY